EVASQQQWLTCVLQQNADTFLFGEHALNSVYFWTQIRPPTAINATVWPYMLRDGQQERIVASLEQRQRVCLIRDGAYPHASPAGSPLSDFLDANFRRHAVFGRIEVWTMKEAKNRGVSGGGKATAAPTPPSSPLPS
ncbi:MAG: hypothetical protein KY475_17075, partial [Planctomycetes bacterium]|nr:hypothetical protein [Planctomycetota bacterium]